MLVSEREEEVYETSRNVNIQPSPLKTMCFLGVCRILTGCENPTGSMEGGMPICGEPGIGRPLMRICCC